MNTRVLFVSVVTVGALALTACGSKGEAGPSAGAGDTLTLGASVSLTGKLAREGTLTQEGYKLCVEKVNADLAVPARARAISFNSASVTVQRA